MTVHVKTDGVIAIPEGFSHVHIEVVESLEVTLELKSNVTGSLYVTVEGTGDLNLTVQTSENSHYKYLWINQSKDKLHVEETIVLEKNAELIANYGEMTQGHHVKNTVVKYVGEGSRVDFRGAIISFNNLKWTIKAHHLAKKTYAMVTCNAIVLDNARLHLEVIGKIDKGFGGSETHQMSRILNLGENVHGVVYPMLLIDENDVAAMTLRHQRLTLLVMLATVALTALLYVAVPKGFFPAQDGGVLQGVTQSSQSTSFDAMSRRQQAVAQSLIRYPNSQIQIVDHTDSTGAAAYNIDLSQRRANSVAAVLRNNGVPAGRISSVGRGEDVPVASNDTAAGRAKNRRVEIRVIPLKQ